MGQWIGSSYFQCQANNTIPNQIQINFNKDTNILLQQTTFKEITCQMSAISVYACMCEMIHELLACS